MTDRLAETVTKPIRLRAYASPQVQEPQAREKRRRAAERGTREPGEHQQRREARGELDGQQRCRRKLLDRPLADDRTSAPAAAAGSARRDHAARWTKQPRKCSLRRSTGEITSFPCLSEHSSSHRAIRGRDAALGSDPVSAATGRTSGSRLDDRVRTREAEGQCSSLASAWKAIQSLGPEEVVDERGTPLGADPTGLAEDLEVMADRRLGDVAAGREVACADAVRGGELPQDGEPGGVGRSLEEDDVGICLALHDDVLY